MNNNYSTKTRLNDNIYLQLKGKVCDENDSSSSDDSVFSDGFDSRLDESFNELISEMKKKRKIEEHQNLSIVHVKVENEDNNNSTWIVDELSDVEPFETYQSSGNGAAVENLSIFVKEEPVEKCQSIENDVQMDETFVINDEEEGRDIPKSEYVDSSSSSISVASNVFDSHVMDEKFNEMISQREKKRKIEEQQLIHFNEERMETPESIENGKTIENLSSRKVVPCVVESIPTSQASKNAVAIQRRLFVDVQAEFAGNKKSNSIANETYGVAVDETSVITNQEEKLEIPKSAVTVQRRLFFDVQTEFSGNKESNSIANETYGVAVDETSIITNQEEKLEIPKSAVTVQRRLFVDVQTELAGNKESNSIANESYGVAVDETSVITNQEEKLEISKNDPMTIGNESYVSDHRLGDLSVETIIVDEIGDDEAQSPSTLHSMVRGSDFEDSNWTDYESDMSNV